MSLGGFGKPQMSIMYLLSADKRYFLLPERMGSVNLKGGELRAGIHKEGANHGRGSDFAGRAAHGF